jgi:segregation and condensation protein B
MDSLKGIIEALIFSSEKPLTIEQMKEVLGGVDTQELRQAIEQLQKEHAERASGVQIQEVAGGFRMITNINYATFVKNLYKIRHVEKLSGPSLETLAIIAYKQPVTRLDIESLRGVNVDGVVNTLLEKGLIRTAGRKEVIGRPFLYATTREFLEYFGLKSLQDLPPIEEFTALTTHAQDVQEALNKTEVQSDTATKDAAAESAPEQAQSTKAGE